MDDLHRFFSKDGNRTAEIRGNDEDVQSAITAIQERFCQPGGGGGGGYRGNNDRQVFSALLFALTHKLDR